MGNYYTRQEIKARTIMLARKSLLLALSQFLSLGFGFVSLYFITNNIPNTPQQPYVGNVAAAIAFVGFFGFMMDLGFGTTHIKKVSEGQDEGRCNGTYLAIKAVFTAIYIPLVLVSIWGYETFYMEFEHGHFTELVLIFLGWGILSNVTIACTTIMIAKQEVAKSTMVAVVSGLFQSIITIIVVLATDNLMIFASTWVIGAVVSAGLGIALILRYPIKLPTLQHTKEYAKFAAPLAFAVSMAPIQQSLDKLMITLFMSNDQTGWYWIAQKYSNVPLNLLTPVAALFLPHQSMLHAARRTKALASYIRKSERFLMMIILPPTMLVAAVSAPFITILTSASYIEAAPILTIMMFNMVIIALAKPYETTFISMGRPRMIFYMKMIFFPMNVMLNILLIPDSFLGIPCVGMGAKGAALATFITFLASLIIKRVLSYRMVPLGISFSVLRQFLAISIAAIVMYVCNEQVWTITRFYELALYGVAGVAIYWSVLVLTKEFTRKDMAMVLDTVNPKKMACYIYNEIVDRKPGS